MVGDMIEVRTINLTGYREWADNLADEYPAEIAHLDGTSVLLLRKELPTVGPAFFETMLAELLDDLGRKPAK